MAKSPEGDPILHYGAPGESTSRRRFYVAGNQVALSVEEPSDRRLRYENWLDPEQQRAFNHRQQWASYEDFCAFFDAPDRPKSRFEATIVRRPDPRPALLPTLAADNTGFDRLEILTHVRAQAVRSMRERLSIDLPVKSDEFDNYRDLSVLQKNVK